MMEFSHGGRERYHHGEEEQSASRNPTFTPSPSSSSSSSCWVSQGEGREPAAAPVAEREHMFDKVVTPSDVGKLNRLVIPKQYAEKYFPLDPTTGEKGLLLCFEEGGTGKPWRFRYSYWNSSQSYVMTKGWSRFVKDKRLDPGDTVSFARGVGESGGGRLFIDWRRRPPDPNRSPLPAAHTMMPLASIAVPWASSRLFGSPAVNMYGGSGSGSGRGSWGQYRVQLGGHGDGTGGLQPVLDSVPVIRGKAEPKRVRLFGVNLECSEPEDGRQALGSGGDHPQRAVRPKPPLSPLQWRVEPPRTDLKPSTELRLRCKGKEDLQE